MPSAVTPRRRCWRRPRFWLGVLALIVAATLLHWCWQPGLETANSADNRARNALWMNHGWLGNDAWFAPDKFDQKPRFRAASNIAQMAQTCRENGIRDLYPHLTPTDDNGAIIGADDAQIERLLDNTNGLRVMPWIGGRLGTHIVPTDKARTARLVASVAALLTRHPRLAGVHLNVEPWRSGDAAMLDLLEQLHAVVGPKRVLSVAAYPPQTGGMPFKMAWSETYLRQVAARCDQMAFMFYDTSIHDRKLYQWFVARWTKASLEWTDGPRAPEVLLGVPTYGDAGTRWGPLYHDPRVENLVTSLAGVRRGLSDYRAQHGDLPARYAGAAIYCEWETDATEWREWRANFARR